MNEIVSFDKLQSDQDRFALAIIEAKGDNLPATITDLIPVLAFSQAKMKAFNALSDAAKKVQDQEALNKAALESGQRWGIVHLYGQKRLGEITREMPTQSRSIVASERSDASKREKLNSQGVDKYTYHDAERIAARPDIIERVIEEAKARGDIPTKTAVLREIKAANYKATVLDKNKEEAPDINDVASSIACKLGELYVKIMKIWEHEDMLSDINKESIRNAIDDIYNIVKEN